MDAIDTTVAMTMDDAEAAVRQRLSEHGFGVLTEIDVAATLQAKLGVSRPGLRILGACNPSLAHRALELDASVALVLPCNVILEELEDGRTRVAIADPRGLLQLSGLHPALADLGTEAAASLEKVVAELAAGSGGRAHPGQTSP